MDKLFYRFVYSATLKNNFFTVTDLFDYCKVLIVQELPLQRFEGVDDLLLNNHPYAPDAFLGNKRPLITNVTSTLLYKR